MILKQIPEITEIQNLLKKQSKIVITTHLNPDGDAIGSILGLYEFLRKTGHNAYPVTPNEYPEFLQWLPGNEMVIDYYRKSANANNIIASADIIFILDYNDSKRGGDMENAIKVSRAVKIMIDHHPNPIVPVNYYISDTSVSSTCELVYEFILALNEKKDIDTTIATCLYTGIMTDTGCFSYNSSQIRTFQIVSQLLEYGINKDEIYHNIYDNYSFQRMRLLGFCLNEKMQYIPQYRCAFISLTIEEQKKYDFTTGDAEGFVNLPLSIKGVVFSALFIERKEKIKISFRSRGDFSVNEFSGRHFSGGGHFNAAGGESKLPMDETINKFREILPFYSNDLDKA